MLRYGCKVPNMLMHEGARCDLICNEGVTAMPMVAKKKAKKPAATKAAAKPKAAVKKAVKKVAKKK
jgi:topoisomerase IA-like protein